MLSANLRIKARDLRTRTIIDYSIAQVRASKEDRVHLAAFFRLATPRRIDLPADEADSVWLRDAEGSDGLHAVVQYTVRDGWEEPLSNMPEPRFVWLLQQSDWDDLNGTDPAFVKDVIGQAVDSRV